MNARRSRKVRERALLGTLLLALVILASACVAAEQSSEVIAADESPIATSPPEPEPTPEVELDPTPQPSATETPTPEPVPSATPELTASEEASDDVAEVVPAPCPERDDTLWIYSTNAGGHEVVVFDTDGAEICRWGDFGTGPGEFNEPFDIATTKDQVFVGDNVNARIQIFSDRGEYQGKWNPGYESNSDWRLGASPSGNYLYAVDQLRQLLTIFDVSNMEIVAERENVGFSETFGVSPWEGDNVAIVLSFGIFIHEPGGEFDVLFHVAELDGVSTVASARLDAEKSISALEFSAIFTTSLVATDAAGDPTDGPYDEDGSVLIYINASGLGLAISGETLVVSERRTGIISTYALGEFPAISLIASWEVDAGDSVWGVDLTSIALSR